jgi:hypothetical protein
MKKTSISSKKRIIKIEMKIKKVLITIPKILENKTSPCLYSFFNGWKKVLSIRDTERREAVYLFTATK